MKKIVFGITSLTLGGAERVLVDIVNKLADEYDITIFTLYSGGELERQLSNKIVLKSLYTFSYNELNWLKKRLIPLKLFFNKTKVYNKNIKEQYDTEIAFLEGPITNLFSVKNNNSKKIAWVHNDISLVFGTGIKAKIKKVLNKNAYEKYHKLIFVSKDNLEKFNEIYNIDVDKQVIYNYIDRQNVLDKSNAVGNDALVVPNVKPTLLSIARLVPQKAIDRLARVHAKLIKAGYNHKIYIIGDGPLKQELQKQVEELQVEDTFILLGKMDNPYPNIKECDIFCLLSYFEGYGMVIEEAKILNKFVLITDTAAREAVVDYPNSKIVSNDEASIYEGIKDLIINDNYLSDAHKFNYDNSDIITKIKELIT